ncbi:MAG: hypothetical protein AAF628_15905 [Planctomycetota bacterium]
MPTLPHRLVVATALGLVLAGSGTAQSALQRDLEFIRALATRLGFVPLALSEIDRVRASHGQGPKIWLLDELELELRLLATQAEPARAAKQAGFRRFMKRSTAMLQAQSEVAVTLGTRRWRAQGLRDYLAFLADTILTTGPDDPLREETTTEAKLVLHAGKTTCAGVIAGLQPSKGEDLASRGQYHLARLGQALLYLEAGRCLATNRRHLWQRACRALEDLAFEAGEATIAGKLAQFAVLRIRGLTVPEDAVTDCSAFIGELEEQLSDRGLSRSGSARQVLAAVLEATYDLLATTRDQLGQPDEVVAVAERYRASLTALGVPVIDLEVPSASRGCEDRRYGHSLYLTYARVLAEHDATTDIRRASGLARFLRRSHPVDALGTRAQSILQGILDANGAAAPADLWLDVAKGHWSANRSGLAIQACRRALAATSDTDDATAFAAWYVIGCGFAQQERLLEATLALKLGLERFGATAEPHLRERAAALLPLFLRQLRWQSNDDPFFAPLADEVLQLAARNGAGGAPGNLFWDEAVRRLSERNGAGAIDAFRRIRPSEPRHGPAQARIATIIARQNRDIGARRAMLDELRHHESPPRAPEDVTEARQRAKGEIAFMRARLAFEAALAHDANESELSEVVAVLAAFIRDYGPHVPLYVAEAHFMLGQAHLELGDLEAAKRQYDALGTLSPRFVAADRLATRLFNAYAERIAAAGSSSDADTLRRAAIDVAVGACENSERPQFHLAILALQHLRELQDWDRIESLGTSIVERLKHHDRQDDIDRFVLPILGHALLQRRHFERAYETLTRAEAAVPPPERYAITRQICLALGGWQDIGRLGGRITERGLRRPAEAYQKLWNEFRPYALRRGVERFSLPWYRFHWECYFFARRAAEQEPSLEPTARKLFDIAKSDDSFARLRALGEPGRELAELFTNQ